MSVADARSPSSPPPAAPAPASPAAGEPTLDERVHRRLVSSLAETGSPTRSQVVEAVREHAPLLPGDQVDAAADRVLARLRGLGPLEPLMADPSVTDILVNGRGPVWVERHGRLEATPIRLDHAATELLIARVLAPLGLRVDRTSPLVDARLPDGSRVNVAIPPLAVDGPCLTIRRFAARTLPLDDFAPAPVVALLRWMVSVRWNVVVSGGTGAGKTTLLNALAGLLPRHERIVTIEDAAELRLPGDHVVRLESRPASGEGVGAVSIRDLVRNALRMRPDRIVVGECRAGEALDMLQALNTGHEGSLTTCHANGPTDALRRLETLALTAASGLPLEAIRAQLTAAVDAVVHIARLPDGSRRVVAVAEVVPDGLGTTRLLADHRDLVAGPRRPTRTHLSAPAPPGVDASPGADG